MVCDPSENLIFHLDVDAFFASVEQLLIPFLRGKPVIVGTGCIASCSYEARRYGLHAGMPLYEARQRCPSAIVLEGQYAIYRCMAEMIWSICREYAVSLETFLDEAYGDVSGLEFFHGDPPTLGRTLQRRVREEVGLSVSVGLAPNRMLAKIASKMAKPAGVRWISPGHQRDVIDSLPIESLPGIGSKTARRLRDLNVTDVQRLRRLNRETLHAMFGRRGEQIYDRARGNDVQDVHEREIPRSVSRETTFHEPTCDREHIRGMLFYLLERAMRELRCQNLQAGTLELNIRYDDWTQLAVRRRLDFPTDNEREAFPEIRELLERLYRRRVALRHVGIVASSLRRGDGQRTLFHAERKEKRRQLAQAMDTIRDRWGYASLVTGKSVELLGTLEQNDYGFVLRTPSLTK